MNSMWFFYLNGSAYSLGDIFCAKEINLSIKRFLWLQNITLGYIIKTFEDSNSDNSCETLEFHQRLDELQVLDEHLQL